MARVAICTPHAGGIQPDWYRHVFEMQLKSPQHTYTHVDVDLMIIGKAREMCIEQVNLTDFDVLFFIDDDTLVPEGAHILIDQAMSLGIVSGVYYSRRLPYTPQIFLLATEPEYKGKYWPYVEMVMDGSIEKVDAVGAGCLAISTSVLVSMGEKLRPHFQSLADKIEDDWLKDLVKNLSPWFEFLCRKGEDMYFCEAAKKAGYDTWVNKSIVCHHIGRIDIGQEHFRYLVDSGLLKKEMI